MTDPVAITLITSVTTILSALLAWLIKRVGEVNAVTQEILPKVNGKLTDLEDKVTLLQRVIVEMGQSSSYTLKRSTDGVPAGTVAAPLGVTVKREEPNA